LEGKLESKMASSTLEHERDKTAGKATMSSPLGAHAVGTGLGAVADRVEGISSLTSENARHAVRDASQRVRDFIERATCKHDRM
jgi:hypothetical protein